MDIWEGGPLAEAKEKYPDILLAQLLDSSMEFRTWFVDRATTAQGIQAYNGVRCNEALHGRETDIMFGFHGEDGDDHIVLIENKITASEQPDQLSDYQVRGEAYVNRGACDRFSVCLLAPKEWETTGARDKVDRMLSYEEVIDRLETLDHDGVGFTTAVFSQAIEKSTSQVPDHSHVTEELWRRVTEESVHDLREDSVTGKHLRCTSAHPDHPGFVIYNIYLADFSDYGNTNLRVQISFDEGSWPETSDIDLVRLKKHFGEEIDRRLEERYPQFRSGYENIRSQNKSVIIRRLAHEGLPPVESEGFYRALLDEFCTLIEHVHPVVVDTDFREIAQRLA